jgi:hypothetical protein
MLRESWLLGWVQELMSRAEQELTPLPQQAAAPEATTWLNHLIAAVMEAAPELLSPAKTPRQLADTEEAVRKAVSSWGEDRLGEPLQFFRHFSHSFE